MNLRILLYSEESYKKPVRLAGGWCWFVLREEYCCLVADKASEHG
jgi:hypothetical protein